MNEQIIAFQNKYLNLLQNLDDKTTDRRNDFAKNTMAKFDKTNANLVNLENTINKERDDRIKENRDNLKKLTEAIDSRVRVYKRCRELCEDQHSR